ncbi:hypothetical protein [Thermococcus sp. LS2]|uniref:hypothetical protein n=1 Tax=Thermococcus sp. LS2 TaxID=1638260 RepID=UPI0016A1BD22|nr:hypothetical protein [Thermococcus sp. LS2]NJE13757.1 hypothetical protein [Thermococcus sp. LS2]
MCVEAVNATLLPVVAKLTEGRELTREEVLESSLRWFAQHVVERKGHRDRKTMNVVLLARDLDATEKKVIAAIAKQARRRINGRSVKVFVVDARTAVRELFVNVVNLPSLSSSLEVRG